MFDLLKKIQDPSIKVRIIRAEETLNTSLKNIQPELNIIKLQMNRKVLNQDLIFIMNAVKDIQLKKEVEQVNIDSKKLIDSIINQDSALLASITADDPKYGEKFRQTAESLKRTSNLLKDELAN